MVNGFPPKEHKARNKTKSTPPPPIDISQEISKAVQSLKTDIEALSLKVSAIERARIQPIAEKQMKKKHWWLDLQPQLIAFLIVWPFIASLIVNRFLSRKHV